MKKNVGGKSMTPQELERINLECDLMDLVNKHAWPHSEKIVKEILTYYTVTRKHERVPVHLARKNASR